MGEDKQRLVVTIMGQDCEKFLPMCLKSVKGADVIVYCDGGSTDDTFNKIKDFEDKFGKNVEIIRNEYNQEDLGMNGKQRNYYLNYLKKHYLNDYCLVLDADEVCDEGYINKLKDFLKENG